MLDIKVHFDGAVSKSQIGCDMGAGIAVFINNSYDEIISKFVGIKGNEESSSNVAEWIGCVEAFKLINELGLELGDQVEVYSDSQIISSQFNGEYQIRDQKFRKYYDEAKRLAKLAGVETIKVKWIPREKNKEADKLSKIGLKSLA